MEHKPGEYERTRDQYVPDLHVWVDNAIQSASAGLMKIKSIDDHQMVLAHVSNEARRLFSYAVCSGMAISMANGKTLEQLEQHANELMDIIRRQILDDLRRVYHKALPNIEKLREEYGLKK